MEKIGFLFGAGAEISYGMPSGGKFALDVFRQSPDVAKETFKNMRAEVDASSDYAEKWLPSNYEERSVSSFGKRVFETIIKDTIGNNRKNIIDKLNDFDSLANDALNSSFNSQNGMDELEELISKDLNKSMLDINIGNLLEYNSLFSDGNQLFRNKYFAALVIYYKDYDKFGVSDKSIFKSIIKSIFQLQLGALSEHVTHELEDSLFKKDKLELDFFDDLGGTLNVNYDVAGIEGLNTLADINIDQIEHKVVKFGYKILEQIYADVLDYKTLIDSNWHYLYNPSTEWAKFSKITLFLYTVKEYIEKQAKNLDKSKGGYYSDLRNQIDSGKIDAYIIGTTNYSSFIEQVLEQEITFLNGGIDVLYDPYLNAIANNNSKHIVVPLLFTQSGTKPMTSIDMSAKYVEFYNKLKESDYIVSIGFGFNSDDEHINGIIRTLIDRDSKELVIVDVENSTNEVVKQKKLAQKLKVTEYKKIKFITVDSATRMTTSNTMWYECL
ncbi:hypothetical protein KAR50_09310 [Periweissella fabaria]|uniref:SIR2-like domain-containing protein n=1 Tax=Periweissella fabaria TaxID=546157 RepID=A0ABM8Z3K2_9LACO|nr:hypothetical protein [Periweissella fabaria]MCM0598027.1 hypothetical protein [Periweissella fabaria]CAH0415910.1 hypothetical protein WFA24289_00208 [Periweissella fabaria]